MIKNYFRTLLALAATMLLTTACVDDNYDLSDIDGTIGISVNELTIPLKVDSISLNQIIEIEEGDQIKIVEDENGKKIYAITEEGTFESDPIDVPGFTTNKPSIDLIHEELTPEEIITAKALGGARKTNSVVYKISNATEKFETTSDKVDSALISLHRIDVINTTFEANIELDPDNNFKDFTKTFTGVKVKLPKGFIGDFYVNNELISSEKYDYIKGILDLSDKNIITDDGKIGIKVFIHSIIAKDNADVVHVDNYFDLHGEIGVSDGYFIVSTDGLTELPRPVIDYTCRSELSQITVHRFTGEIKYDIDDFEIDPVTLSNIPDFLNDKETNIQLANPQIYINVTNPVAHNGAKAETGLEITAIRDNGADKTFSLDEGSKIKIESADNVLCLAPADFAGKMRPGYENATLVPFTSLSNILSGQGLPDQLAITAVAPRFPQQLVSDFELDQTIEPVQGTYYLFAPLAIEASSNIVYTDTLKDWYDETLEKLTISKVKVNANIVSDIPLELTVNVAPIDVNGIRLDNVVCNEVHVDAFADSELEFNIEGDIKNLDGIIIEATLHGAKDNTSLSPDQKIDVKKLRVTVSGQYIDEM